MEEPERAVKTEDLEVGEESEPRCLGRPKKEKKMEFSEEVSHRKNCHRSSIEPPCFRKLPEPIVLEWRVGQSDICKRIWIDSSIFKSLKE